MRPAGGGVDLWVDRDLLPFPTGGVGTDHDPDGPQRCEVVNDSMDDVRVEMGPDETPGTPRPRQRPQLTDGATGTRPAHEREHEAAPVAELVEAGGVGEPTGRAHGVDPLRSVLGQRPGIVDQDRAPHLP